MTDKGQDKGHAVVSDELRDESGREVDFLLPQDTKQAVKLDSGQTFVGLSFVHGHNHMRLDVQSLINLYPFFQEEQLLTWLKQEGELFIHAVETGDVADMMARIDSHTTLEDIRAWPLREYLASGGHPMWFRAHVKALLNQHLKRLQYTTLGKMRLPIPGGRHYVMPAGVGQRAGIGELNVSRGHIHIDDEQGTAWVNDEDWLALADSPNGAGIADILGGADNDDALWLHPFTDYDGKLKILAWRSPNQVGEYVVLQPTDTSHGLEWITADGEDTQFGVGDSRKLPARIDFTDPHYLGLVNPESLASQNQMDRYHFAVMDEAIQQSLANRGALGMYCNALMLNKALFGGLPDNPPAPLEAIIDSAVKTGADLSQVVTWNYANSRRILESRVPIPAGLHSRLSIDWSDKDNRPPPPRVSDPAGANAHWFDKLEMGINQHIQQLQQKRDELIHQAYPPQAILNLASSDLEAVKLGAQLNTVYATTLRRSENVPVKNRLERAKIAVFDYLAHFPPPQRKRILLGALASIYSKDTITADTSVWLAKRKTVEQQSVFYQTNGAVAHLTIQALREIGVLDDIVVTEWGLVVYPSELYH